MKRLTYTLCFLAVCLISWAENVNIITPSDAGNRVEYAAQLLQKKLAAQGHTMSQSTKANKKAYNIYLSVAQSSSDLKKEGFTITCTRSKKGKVERIDVTGNDATGCIYGCVELATMIGEKDISALPGQKTDAPEMVLRGGCIGVQKPYLLPGRTTYEYPYTPELFPWFYDKTQWIEYLDMLVENRMNSLYLWNGHPFASLVKLDDYPFAVEVDDATFEKNKEIFAFLTREADKRGIFVIQMFYNILVSKPFAEHYGIKTQDRHRPIDACDGKIQDYTYKSIKAFIENYPNVGLLVCLGEAMDTYQDDVDWMTGTIIPAVKDGLKTLGRTDEPPLLLRAHDTDCKMVMEASLPLYKNLYTMSKYTGESLTTYQPQGPWAETHRSLAALGSTHISNVHILANLEPWRWSSPDFIQKTVNAMHNVHHANALHLYPQASYWDWPYTADAPYATQRDATGKERVRQIDRDWMWYAAWGRYAWNCHRDRNDEMIFWDASLAAKYTTTTDDAAKIRTALEESAEIAPKLLRRFGITEGNRQSLLLGMFCSQLVNPYKYTVYPDFYESCGPDGLKLIDYVARKFGQPAPQNIVFPNGTTSEALMAKADKDLELPLDIVAQCMAHGDKAVAAIDAIKGGEGVSGEELSRLRNDIHCYREFAYSFGKKVQACEHVLNYKYNSDITELETAVPLLETSLDHYRKLVALTNDTYLYAQSMQTSMRRIPISGENAQMKHWNELLPKYEEELANLKKNIAQLKTVAEEAQAAEKAVASKKKGAASVKKTAAVKTYTALKNAKMTLPADVKTIKLTKGVKLFSDLDSIVTDYAPELDGLQAYVFSAQQQRNDGTVLDFKCDKPVTILVGYFRDDQRKYAPAPKLEIDATASEYGQQDPCFTSAIRINGMPQVNVHPYHFAAGSHQLQLPKGLLLVLGYTNDKITPRDAALSGTDAAIDWLFY